MKYNNPEFNELIQYCKSTGQLISQEIKDKYGQCKNHKKFRESDSFCRRSWYYKFLKQRITRKVLNKYKFDIFNRIDVCLTSLIPELVKKETDNFADVRNVGIGDKVESNYFYSHM